MVGDLKGANLEFRVASRKCDLTPALARAFQNTLRGLEMEMMRANPQAGRDSRPPPAHPRSSTTLLTLLLAGDRHCRALPLAFPSEGKGAGHFGGFMREASGSHFGAAADSECTSSGLRVGICCG